MTARSMFRAPPIAFDSDEARCAWEALAEIQIKHMQTLGWAYAVAPLCAVVMPDGRTLFGGERVNFRDFEGGVRQPLMWLLEEMRRGTILVNEAADLNSMPGPTLFDALDGIAKSFGLSKWQRPLEVVEKVNQALEWARDIRTAIELAAIKPELAAARRRIAELDAELAVARQGIPRAP